MEEERFDATPEDLQILRAWMKQVPHIPEDMDEAIISYIFKVAKGRLQKAKDILETFCSCGYKLPEMFSDLNIDNMEVQGIMKGLYVYEKTTKNEGIICFAQRPDVEIKKIFRFYRVLSVTMLMIVKEYPNCSGKLSFLLDCKKIPLESMKDFTPAMVSAFVGLVKKGIPCRPVGFHIMNLPSAYMWLYEMIKYLIPEKIGKRMMTHSGPENIQQYLSKDLLANEYGGTCGTLEELTDQWKVKANKHKNFIIDEENKIRKLYHLRPKDDVDDLNTDTFRKLNVD